MLRVLPRATAPRPALIAWATLLLLVVSAGLVGTRADRADAAGAALDAQSWADTQGTPVPGAYVTADPGTWAEPQPATIDYQWLRDGAAIPGATSRDYLVAPSDVGHALAPQVTGSRPGYTSDSFTGTTLQGRAIATTVTLQLRRAVPPGKHRRVWVAQVGLSLERPWSDEGTVTVTKRHHGGQKVLATATTARGTAFVRLPWRHAPRGRSTLTACFSGSAALAASCSTAKTLKR